MALSDKILAGDKAALATAQGFPAAQRARIAEVIRREHRRELATPGPDRDRIEAVIRALTSDTTTTTGRPTPRIRADERGAFETPAKTDAGFQGQFGTEGRRKAPPPKPGELGPQAAAQVAEIDAEIERQRLLRESLQDFGRGVHPLDKLLAGGAIHTSGPNRGEINERALIKAADAGRSVDEVADELINRHPGLFRDTNTAGTTLNKDDQLRQALERRLAERRSLTTATPIKDLEARKAAIIAGNKFETRSTEIGRQPVAITNAFGRFDQLSEKTKKLDLSIPAERVAPETPANDKDITAQRRWFRDPTQLDFEGVDTGPRVRAVNKLGR